MAYSELIKNFDRIRDYMRQFYVYGFRSRKEYKQRSARSYDNERRRVESWLGDYMDFHRNESGKQVFLSVDSRSIEHNPLYDAFKAKSFTSKDIALHFYILDILEAGRELTLAQLTDEIQDAYLSCFPDADALDSSTLRKKLKEYIALGLICTRKQGNKLLYRRNDAMPALEAWRDAIDFFSEEAPLGVAGSYLLDRMDKQQSRFRFKHHYLLHALDGHIMYALVEAIMQRRSVHLRIHGSEKEFSSVCPLRIWISAQTGRQYVLCHRADQKRFCFIRIDSIDAVVPGAIQDNYDALLVQAAEFTGQLWGVSTGTGGATEHVEMVLRMEAHEPHILQRLLREKRCGTVEVLDENTLRFTADVYDAREMLPWVRSFTGRILSFTCSNPGVEETFRSDLNRMYALYGGDHT